MGALDRVLLAAEGTSEDEVHAHLMKQCPWYQAVSKGESSSDPAKVCELKHAGVKQAVKLTPRTPEASTVPEPTRPPGGPGLFHIKGRELPPYIQHLWHHLVKEYGEHKAYGVAVGIVKKWKAGINPGGRHKKGHVSHVHADVQAAAAKNIAQWEQDKADAHKQSSGHVRASAGDSGPTKTKAEAHYRESDSDTKRCGTCSMFRDGHCTLVKGSIEPDHVCDYWEKSKTVALAMPAATAPGAAPVPKAGPYQRPSQTVSPSPPLPPDVKLPTAAEIRKLKAQVPDCTDASLSSSARNHLDAAAVKLQKDDVLAALHVLRAAQSDVYAAHKADLGMAMPAVYTANVFTKVPEAEVSSANKEMIRSKDKEMKWRALEQGIAIAIDRIRRKHYHGSYGGIMQQGMFSADSESSLDKVVRLAGGPGAGR